MIVDSLNEYIDILAGHLYDNDKVVTYKWLSKELEVHVNVAKHILWEFHQKHQQQDDIVCTHLLMGTLNDGGIHVEVVKDENLSSAKEKYSNIIAEHIYSLQKTLPDIELLAISGDGDVKFSAIQCSECTQRSDDEMHVLRWGSNMSNEITKSNNQKPKPVVEKEKPSKPEVEVINTVVQKPPAKQKKGFDSLFGKPKGKQKTPAPKHTSPTGAVKSTKEVSPKQEVQASPKKKGHQSDINSFWGPSKQQESTSKAEVSETKKIDHNSDFEEEKHVKNTTSDTKKGTKKEARGKKRTRSKESASTKPKRKRIILDSASSDSEVSMEEDEVIEIPPSPEKVAPKNRSPSPPKVKLEGGKRKVLKVVDKTFEEDGYFVTKKVHVYESCSEEEPEEVPVKKTTPPENRLDPKGKKITKQTTLMNFFKKS